MSRGAKAISGVVALLAMGGMCCTSAAGDPRYLDGQIIVDPDNPAWLARYAVGGDQVPFFMAGPGDPEGFLYRGSRIPDGTRDGDQVGWTNGSGVTNNGVSGGTWDLVMSGVEPKVFGPTLSAPADLATVVEIGMSSTDTNTSGKFFWKVEGDADFSAQRSQAFTILSDGQIHSYRFDLSHDSDWTDTITGLRLDPVASSHGGDVSIDCVRLLALLPLGDVNLDGELDGLDVEPFVDVLLGGLYQHAADMNGDGHVNGLDFDPFVAAVLGRGGAGTAAGTVVPEPSASAPGRRRILLHRAAQRSIRIDRTGRAPFEGCEGRDEVGRRLHVLRPHPAPIAHRLSNLTLRPQHETQKETYQPLDKPASDPAIAAEAFSARSQGDLPMRSDQRDCLGSQLPFRFLRLRMLSY